MNKNRYLVLIGSNIRKYRKEKNLTIEELGLECGIDKSNLAPIEKGNINVTIGTLTRISEALQIDLKELFE